MNDDVLNSIVNASRPVDPPEERFAYAPAKSLVRQLPPDLADLEAALREQFSAAALRDANVLRQSPGEHEVLAPWFTPAGLFLPLQRSAKARITDLLADAGCLVSQDFAINAVCTDFRVRRDEERCPQLVLAYSMQEVDALQRLGFSASLGTDLTTLSGHGLKLLCGIPALLAKEREWDETPKKFSPIRKTHGLSAFHVSRNARCALLAWDPVGLSPKLPAQLLDVARFLVDAQQNFGFNLQNFSVWLPDEKALNQIGAAFAGQDPEVVGAAVRRSRRENSMSLGAYMQRVESRPPPPLDEALRDARRRLEVELRASLRVIISIGLKSARQDYLAALERAFVSPWRERAANDPQECGSLAWYLADLNSRWAALDPLLRTADYKLRHRVAASEAPTATVDAERRDALAEQIAAAVERLQRLEQRRPVRQPASRKPAPDKSPEAPLLSPSLSAHEALSDVDSRPPA